MFETNLESHPLLNAELIPETYLLESTQIKMVELVMNNDPGWYIDQFHRFIDLIFFINLRGTCFL